MIDRITTPDVDPRMVLESAPDPSEPTINSVYFGFISMKQPKSMLNTRGSESIKYCTFVNTIFSVLGFTYALLIVLNSEIPITAVYQDSVQANILAVPPYLIALCVASAVLSALGCSVGLDHRL